MSKRSESDMRNCSGQYLDELYVLDERYVFGLASRIEPDGCYALTGRALRSLMYWLNE